MRELVTQVKLFSLMVAVLCAAFAHAQSSSGGLRGMVEDSASARIVGASVEADLSGSAQSRHTVSNARGEFLLEGLAPGSWQVTVSANGFRTASAEIDVAVSTTRDLAVTMRPAVSQQLASVQAQGSSITS